MFCPNCGSPVSDGSRFCSNCGAQLPAAAAPQPTPVQETAPQPVWSPEPINSQQSDQAQTAQQQDYRQAWQPQAAQQPDYQPQPFQQQDYQQAWQQSAAVPVVAKKRSARKGILIGVGCLVLAALIGGGVWFLSRGRSQNKLLRAAGNTLAELKAYTQTLPNLNKIVENAEALSDSDTIHTEQTMRSDMSFSYGGGEAFSYGNTIQYRMDRDGKAGTVLLDGVLDVALGDEGTKVPFTFYLDREQLQAASGAILDDGEVVAIPLKDLAKQWNSSALAEVTELTLPEELDLSNYSDFDLSSALEETYGQDWITLRDSFDSVVYEGESPFTGPGTTYALTWDREALQRMYDKTDLDFDNLIELDLSEVQEKLDPNELISQIFIAVLGEFNKEISAPLFYVEDELLLGLRLTAAEEAEAPMELIVWLMGENNPWEHVSVLIHEDFGSYTTDDHVDFALKQENGQLRIEYNARHEDSDGEEYRTEEGPYSIVYNDADGRITVEDEEGQVPEDMPEILLLPEEGGFRFFYSKSENYDDTVFSTELTTVITNRVRAIAPLSATPTELLKLSEEELKDLAERIEEKLGQFE